MKIRVKSKNTTQPQQRFIPVIKGQSLFMKCVHIIIGDIKNVLTGAKRKSDKEKYNQFLELAEGKR